jgi:hypothetical protein
LQPNFKIMNEKMAAITNYDPFLFYNKQLADLFQKAAETENPALFLYQNGARNVVFMLEGLTRIHKNAFADSKMEKWYERFKKMEDLFGQIDYFDSFKKQFEKSQILPEKSLAKLTEKADNSVAALNKMLKSKNWLTEKTSKFEVFIIGCAFKFDENHVAKITEAYQIEVQKITDLATKLNFKCTKLETELHEMRRKLRWLSIYAQAFQGLFQLKKPRTAPEWSKKYLLPEIVNSPFNQLPKPIKNLPIIRLNYYSFIALSFIIQKFGGLKDQGLQNLVIEQDLQTSRLQTKFLLGEKYADENVILETASAILKTFFEDDVLKNLIA